MAGIPDQLQEKAEQSRRNKLYLRIVLAQFWKYRWLILVLMILSIAGALFLENFIPGKPVAKTSIWVPKRKLTAYLELAKSRDNLFSAWSADPFSRVKYTRMDGGSEQELYDDTPFIVYYDSVMKSLEDQPFGLKFISDAEFQLNYTWNDETFQKEYSFGQPFSIGISTFEIHRNPEKEIDKNGTEYRFTVLSDQSLISTYSNHIFFTNLKTTPEKIAISYIAYPPKKAVKHLELLTSRLENYHTYQQADSSGVQIRAIDNNIQRIQAELGRDSVYFKKNIENSRPIVSSTYKKFTLLSKLKSQQNEIREKRDEFQLLADIPGYFKKFLLQYGSTLKLPEEKVLLELLKEKEKVLRSIEKGNSNASSLDSLSANISSQVATCIRMAEFRMNAVDEEISSLENAIADMVDLREADFSANFADNREELRTLLRWTQLQNLLKERIELIKKSAGHGSEILILEKPYFTGWKKPYWSRRAFPALPIIVLAFFTSIFALRPVFLKKLKDPDEIRFVSRFPEAGELSRNPAVVSLLLTHLGVHAFGKKVVWIFPDVEGFSRMGDFLRFLSERSTEIELHNFSGYNFAVPGEKDHAEGLGDLLHSSGQTKLKELLEQPVRENHFSFVLLPALDQSPIPWQAILECDAIMLGVHLGATTLNEFQQVSEQAQKFAPEIPTWFFHYPKA